MKQHQWQLYNNRMTLYVDSILSSFHLLQVHKCRRARITQLVSIRQAHKSKVEGTHTATQSQHREKRKIGTRFMWFDYKVYLHRQNAREKIHDDENSKIQSH